MIDVTYIMIGIYFLSMGTVPLYCLMKVLRKCCRLHHYEHVNHEKDVDKDLKSSAHSSSEDNILWVTAFPNAV